MRKLVLMLAALCVTACQSTAPMAPPPPPPPPPPPMVEPSPPKVTMQPVLVEIGRADERAPANGGSAVVLLRSAPRTAYENLALCAALKERLSIATSEQIAVGIGTEDGEIVAYRPVYWLTTSADDILGVDTCARAIEAYDFARADILRRKYGLTGTGPQLLVVRADDQQAAVVDLANRSAADIRRLVGVFADGLAFRRDVWDPSVMTADKRRSVVQTSLGANFRESLLAAIALITAPAAQAGCRVGDLSDAPCT